MHLEKNDCDFLNRIDNNVYNLNRDYNKKIVFYYMHLKVAIAVRKSWYLI